jgi:hypothetical protein
VSNSEKPPWSSGLNVKMRTLVDRREANSTAVGIEVSLSSRISNVPETGSNSKIALRMDSNESSAIDVQIPFSGIYIHVGGTFHIDDEETG